MLHRNTKLPYTELDHWSIKVNPTSWFLCGPPLAKKGENYQSQYSLTQQPALRGLTWNLFTSPTT